MTVTEEPAGLRIAHSVYPKAGGWYVVRIVFDGAGGVVGTKERACYDQRTACEVARLDALKFTPQQYRTIASAESRAREVREEAGSRREQLAAAQADLDAAVRDREAIDIEIDRCMRNQKSYPSEADLPKRPDNLPAHLAMKYEHPETRESEANREKALRSVRAGKDWIVQERRRAVDALALSSDVEARVQKELVRGELEWIALARAAVDAGWG